MQYVEQDFKWDKLPLSNTRATKLMVTQNVCAGFLSLGTTAAKATFEQESF